MRHVSRRHIGWLLTTAIALAPLAAQAQTGAAGIVTTLQGEASVTRTSATQPSPLIQPLKFRESVYAKDLITTGDRSLARILLGGAAVITVREHSTLRIMEQGTTATVDITDGKIALVVAKERLAGGRIDVRTPNAIAGVRGTILITEVGPAPLPLGPQRTSTFTLLEGLVDVSLLDPAGLRVGSPVTLNALQTVGITGFTPPPPVRTITRAQGQALANNFHANLKEPPTGTQHVTDQHVTEAANAAGAGAGTGARVDVFASLTPRPISPMVLVSGDDTRNGSNHNPAMDSGGNRNPVVCRTCECIECLVGGTFRAARARSR
jgi:FecR-like protein